MKKHLIFFHQRFPAQFGPIIQFLKKEYDVQISFLSEFAATSVPEDIKNYLYTVEKKPPGFFFSAAFESECRSMASVFQAFIDAKIQDPDVFIGHVSFGNLMFLHLAYPQVPTVGLFEIFFNPFDRHALSRPEYPVKPQQIFRQPLLNATLMLELEYCTKGYSPTPYQHSTFPKAYQDKLAVLFDGIDTTLYQPGEVPSNSLLQRTWPQDAPIVTFVSRGLESIRGFDIFMEVAYRVSQRNPNVHFVIAGNPKTHYGSEMLSIQESTFKEHVLKRYPFDLSRFHFLDWIPESALVDLFRLSVCHFYWTIPFTLSWSFFQAMSTGTLILGSDSAPVRDVLIDGVNGLIVPSRDIEEMVERLLEILGQPEKFKPIQQAARETILQQYSFEVCLPKLAEFYLS